MCERWGLSKLASTLKKSKGATLQVFCSAKTHKEGCPFRAIVTERGSWQRALGRFLQAPLARLGVDDPFLVRSSCEVSDFFLESQSAKTLDAFSIDIKDLYYNLPRGSVLKAVCDAVDQFGNVGFQSECGISTGKFLEALNFYLDSTYVEYSGSLYLQKEGVCIGSSLAPVLSDLLLASLDRQLQMTLEGKSVVKTFRYVDDYLVVFKKKCGAEAEQVGELLDVFTSVLSPFSLTTEVPERRTIRFLDMSLTFCGHHVCWEYAPRSQKGFLPFSSAHTKLVERGIVRAALKNSVLRSRHHSMFQSLQA
ncbi:uncharacterized protein LOC144143175 [Haemaphysalis longicornis]